MDREFSDSIPLHPRSAGPRPGPTGRVGPASRLAAALLFAAAALLAACDSSSPTEPCMGPMNVTGNVIQPVKIFSPAPQYTEEARQARIQGTVILQAIIDCRGFVTDVNVIKGLPLGLTEAAISAISQWRFEPATLDGRPVSVYYNLTVNFRLA